MTDKIIFATKVDDGSAVELDVDYLIEHRMQVLGNSGSGKSRMIRGILERSKGKFQHIVISPKSEFATLREKFDYLHVGKTSEITKPDIELNTRYAGQLALKLLETGMDTIIEFSEAPLERVKYVRNFVESLMAAPAHLWHPVMIVIDEIDIWAPEKGHGEAESLQAIVDLAARGRDKGFFLVAATQKLSKFNKDVASELDIKLVGKVSLDNDQDRAAKELGIPLKQKGELRWLGAPNFHFYAFGPGLSDEVIKIKSMDVQTTHISGYKKNKNQKPIPTPGKIKQLLAAFSDLPQEAEKVIKTKEGYEKRISELTIELTKAKKEISLAISSSPKIDPQALQQAEQRGFKKAWGEALRQVLQIKIDAERYIKYLENEKDSIKSSIENVHTKLNTLCKLPIPQFTLNLPEFDGKYHTDLMSKSVPVPPLKVITKSAESTNRLQIDSGSSNLKPVEIKVLMSILSCKNYTGTTKKIAIMNEYSESGGAFQNIRGKLRTSGYVTYQGNLLVATQKAIDEFPDYPRSPTTAEEIFQHWCAKLAPAEIKILTPIYESGSNSIFKADVAEKTGYSPEGGSFQNIMGRLRTLGLIEYLPDKMVQASKELMGEE